SNIVACCLLVLGACYEALDPPAASSSEELAAYTSFMYKDSDGMNPLSGGCLDGYTDLLCSGAPAYADRDRCLSRTLMLEVYARPTTAPVACPPGSCCFFS